MSAPVLRCGRPLPSCNASGGSSRGHAAAAALAVASTLVALLVAGPLLALPASFLGEGDALDAIATSLLPEALLASLVLGTGVAAGTLLLGGGLAALVSFYDSPAAGGWTGRSCSRSRCPATSSSSSCSASTTRRARCSAPSARVLGVGLPDIRTTAGAITVLTLVLYPYVYTLAAAHSSASRASRSRPRARSASPTVRRSRRVALPLARPALGAGVALAVMEALADFGAVNLLGYRALTDAIYRVWYGAFDQAAALQLATVLVGLALRS